MSEREERRADVLQALGEAWDAKPELPFGQLLLEVLQPERRIPELKRLDDEFFLMALDSYVSVFGARRPV